MGVTEWARNFENVDDQKRERKNRINELDLKYKDSKIHHLIGRTELDASS